MGGWLGPQVLGPPSSSSPVGIYNLSTLLALIIFLFRFLWSQTVVQAYGNKPASASSIKKKKEILLEN